MVANEKSSLSSSIDPLAIALAHTSAERTESDSRAPRTQHEQWRQRGRVKGRGAKSAEASGGEKQVSGALAEGVAHLGPQRGADATKRGSGWLLER